MRHSFALFILILFALALSACASSTLPPLPTRVFTPTAELIATRLPPPTLTATPLPPATSTRVPATPTPEFPPLPRGMGGLIIVNNFTQELGLDIASKFYKIPPKSKLVLFLPPGRHTFSATIPGFNGRSGTTEITEGFYRKQEWG